MKFTPGRMRRKYGGDSYAGPAPSPGRANAALPFYSRLFAGPLGWICLMAARGRCDDFAWSEASCRVGDLLEQFCPLFVEGLENFRAAAGPCVVVGNHMSTLETFVLPGMLRPEKPVTFVVKESLVRAPFFGPVMRSRDPVVVGRQNPREDLAAVLEGGAERLARGISVIVFPQSTRSVYFDKNRFNSIGVKLARRANVPVVPLALKTDAWGRGKKIKDFGRVARGMPVRFKFAKPMRIAGNGREEQAAICEFIGSTLARWQAEDGVNV